MQAKKIKYELYPTEFVAESTTLGTGWMEKEKEMGPPAFVTEQCTKENIKQDLSMVGVTFDTLMATVLMRSL